MKKLILFISLILFIPKVHAVTSLYWGTEVQKPLSVDMFNCVQGNCDDSINVEQILGSTQGTADNFSQSSYFYNTEDMTIATYGIITSMRLNQELQKNYLYSLTLYACSNYNLPYNSTSFKPFLTSTYNGAISQPSNTLAYSSINFNNYANVNAFYGYSANTCRAIYMVLSPTNNSTFFSFRLNGYGNTYSNVTLDIIGYDLSELGIYSGALSDEVENIVSNSGFATSSSVQEVQNSVNEVQQEMQEVNSSIDQQTQQQQQNHQETMDTITSSDVDSPNNSFSEFESYLPENGVITQLITLPISLFQRVLSSINGTCSQYNLGNLMGTDLILPCINISNYIGTTLWNVIDVLFSGLFVLVIGKKMIKAFNNFSSMEEGDVLD